MCFFLRTLALSASPSVAGHDIKPEERPPQLIVPPWWGHMPWAALALQVPFTGLGWGWGGTAVPGGLSAAPGHQKLHGLRERFESVWCASALAFHMVLRGSGGFKCLGGKFQHRSINKVCNKKDSLSLPCSCPPSRLSKPIQQPVWHGAFTLYRNTAVPGLRKDHVIRVTF